MRAGLALVDVSVVEESSRTYWEGGLGPFLGEEDVCLDGVVESIVFVVHYDFFHGCYAAKGVLLGLIDLVHTPCLPPGRDIAAYLSCCTTASPRMPTHHSRHNCPRLSSPQPTGGREPKDRHDSHSKRRHTSVTGSLALHSKKRYGQNIKRVVPGCWRAPARCRWPRRRCGASQPMET